MNILYRVNHDVQTIIFKYNYTCVLKELLNSTLLINRHFSRTPVTGQPDRILTCPCDRYPFCGYVHLKSEQRWKIGIHE